ncbi:MAG: hypothetical protein JNL38_12770 [Myxococcales bacterium]|nr:hypothetical protein [Myxococcales bacterium]
MLRKSWRNIFIVLLLLLVASCSGGGCSSGCGGCGGTTPLPGGFPRDKAIENAASVRLTRPGLDFVAENIPAVATKITNAPGGVMTIDIPKVDPPKTEVADLFLFKVYVDPLVCPDGPKNQPPQCKAQVNLGKSTFHLDAINKSSIVVSGVIPLKVADTPVNANIDPGPNLTMHVGYGNGGCSGTVPNVTEKALPVSVTIPLVSETISPRNGYTKIDVDKAVIDLSGLKNDDVHVCLDCGLLTFACTAISDSGFVKGLILNPLKDGLEGQVKDLLKDSLCTKPNPALNPACPSGSKPDSGNKYCTYTSKPDTCVPTLLGLDSHIDLSGALKSISPGTTGGLDFGIAGGGDMIPYPKAAADNVGYPGHTPNGVTLSMLGGALPQPKSSCVPDNFKLDPPTGIPVPQELTQDTIPGWPGGKGPHVGIALAGRFLNFALGSVYQSGTLCLGVSTEQVAQLQTGLLSVLIPSIKNLTIEQKSAAVAIATRPQVPPTVKIGTGKDIKTDPLLAVKLDKFAIDFYVWSYDRYVRAFTFEGDVTVPVNLSTGKDPKKNPNGGLLPVLGDLAIANGKVTNADLLLDDPARIASALQSILGGLSGQLVGGGFNAIDLSGALKAYDLGLSIPDGGIRKLTSGQDDFLAIFADLTKAPTAASFESDTTVKIVGKTVHPEAMTFAGYDRTKLPELKVSFGSNASAAVEYSYQIDDSTRSAWTRDRDIVIKEDYLFFQGRHTLKAFSRVVGQPESEDVTPATAEFVIDALPPTAKVEREEGGFTVAAWDFVSDDKNLTARYKIDGAEFGPWRPVSELAHVAAKGSEVTVEVKDEEGNVASISQPLIRGRGDSTLAAGGSGCGCSTPGGKSGVDLPGVAGVVLVAAFLGILALRRARRGGAASHKVVGVLGLGSVAMVASTSQGCACGSEESSQTGCGADCNTECEAALKPGLVGAYTSVARASDGSIWVAGYNDAVLSPDFTSLYGDLVVGKYDTGRSAVDWQTVDGVPSRSDGTCPDHDRNGWRTGETEAGDDVGLWTSIAIGKGDTPMVSYYDLTHTQLKFAIKGGEGWKSYVLKGGAPVDAGRYSKMILDGGKPVIAFLQMEPGTGGKTRSKVTLARATEELPGEPGAWTFSDIAVTEDGPCRPTSCKTGEACVKDTGSCSATTGGCTPADCGAGKACVSQGGKATCVNVVGKDAIETYPNAFGAYVSLATGPNGLGVVVYDRIHGNLVAIQPQGSGWQQVILDGETGSRKDNTALDTGDVGMGASLFISQDGTWHVSYVNGVDETLRYVSLAGGKPGRPEIVDDGFSVDNQPFKDGKHIVGDDSTVSVESSGAISIFYQDATAGTLRAASGVVQGGARKWSKKTIAQPDKFAGFFPRAIDGKVANFWRKTDKGSREITGDVSLLAP